MDEATLRFFEELGDYVQEDWSDYGYGELIAFVDINDMLKDHLPLLRYYKKKNGTGYELRIGGKREE